MHMAPVPSCFSSLLNTFQLFQAVLGCAECFSSLHFYSVLSTSRLYQTFFSAMLSTFRLCQAFFFSSERFSCLLGIFLLFRAFFFLLCQAFSFYAVQYTAERKNTRQGRKKRSAWKKNAWKSRKVFSIAEKCLEEPKSVQHSRKMLGRAEDVLSIDEKYLTNPLTAQQRRKKQIGRAANVYIRGVLYL